MKLTSRQQRQLEISRRQSPPEPVVEAPSNAVSVVKKRVVKKAVKKAVRKKAPAKKK